MPLAGGFMGYGYQCGMLWGAALAAGAQAYQLFGAGPKAETVAVMVAQRLVEAFRDRNKYINCADITEMNWKEASKRQMRSQVFKYLLKGGPITCFSMSASYARITFDEINLTLSEKHNEAPRSPASCATMLAKKMGASGLHAVMAAGLAGGIGLSGGACGALGAAIWLSRIGSGKEGDGKTNIGNFYDDPIALATIERYLESADYEFECSKIAGRTFENVDDHAAYLRAGGCSKIIEALASPG